MNTLPRGSNLDCTHRRDIGETRHRPSVVVGIFAGADGEADGLTEYEVAGKAQLSLPCGSAVRRVLKRGPGWRRRSSRPTRNTCRIEAWGKNGLGRVRAGVTVDAHKRVVRVAGLSKIATTRSVPASSSGLASPEVRRSGEVHPVDCVASPVARAHRVEVVSGQRQVEHHLTAIDGERNRRGAGFIAGSVGAAARG